MTRRYFVEGKLEFQVRIRRHFLSYIFKESAEQQIKFDPGCCRKLSELVPLVAKFFSYFKVRFFLFCSISGLLLLNESRYSEALSTEFSLISSSSLLFSELAFVPSSVLSE